MKKLLLSAFAVASALAMNAQDGGISETGVYDDFLKASDYSDEYSTVQPDRDSTYKGIFWWNTDATTDATFSAEKTRDNDGVLLYDINQVKGGYEPIGVGFGDDENGDPYTINLGGTDENAALVSFSFTNNSETTVEFKVAMTDINDIQIGFDKSALEEDDNLSGNLYMYEIGATSEGEDLNFGTAINVVTTGATVDFSYDFKNAISAEYQLGTGGCKNVGALVCSGTCFDYTQVKQITITVVETVNDPDQCYDKEAFKGQIALKEFRAGDFVTGLFDFGVSSNDFEVYPNPATDNVNFAKRLTNVEVYNAQGSLVETLGSANALNVSSYEAGVYFIKATEGTSRVVVK